MRIAVVAGICVSNDAISNAVVDQIEILSTVDDIEAVTLYTQASNRSVPVPAHIGLDPWRMVTDQDFRHADLAIFHWGIAYELFDGLVLAPTGARRCAVHFHNVTPLELLTGHDRDKGARSLAQAVSLPAVDTDVWTYSEFNRRTLLGWGVPDNRLFHVPIAVPAPTPVAANRRVDRFDLLTVGRLVPAKGAHVLVEAVALLERDVGAKIHVTIAGNVALSDKRYVSDLRDSISNSDLDDTIELRDAPPPLELAELFARAHAVVSPSFHEGLCIPVIEGYLAGCRAIGTTAGNLPFAIFDPDPLVPPGDPVALARAIEAMAHDVLAGTRVDCTAARSYAESFSPQTAARQLIERVLESVTGIGTDAKPGG